MRKPVHDDGPMAMLSAKVSKTVMDALNDLHRRTRVPRSVYVREALKDLLAKYKNGRQQ